MKSKAFKDKIVYKTDSPSFLLWQLNALWLQEKVKAFQKVDNISSLQYTIMVNIHWFMSNNVEVTQVSLAEHLNMAPMNISQALKILERRKLIIRRESLLDSRAKLVSLTEVGISIVKKAIEKVEETEKIFFGKLQKDLDKFTEDMRTLIALYK